MATEHLDVLVVGAGLSGISAAHYLQARCPGTSFAILEARDRIGGTWDLFRYPGVRSDSDMHTLGYSFRPWRGTKAITEGPAIRSYIEETAAELGVDQKIRFGHRLRAARWSSADARWTVEVERGPGRETATLTCGFLLMCIGYYRYDRGYAPAWPGVEEYRGQVVHPQQWPEGLDYTGRRVLVIGSGATAVTLVPALAERAAHVTMLQRSPSYVVSIPADDPTAKRIHAALPEPLATPLTRWAAILTGMFFYLYCRWRPEKARRAIMDGARHELGAAADVDTHFAPRYGPWDQRVCFAPDGDFFAAIRSGRASVVTGQIERFTEGGVRLEGGEELAADVVVSATGLVMEFMSDVALSVDGRPVDLAQTMTYKGLMYSGVPNLASVFGYTNASWTLKAELIEIFVCRLLRHMQRRGYASVTPVRPGGVAERPALDLSSGYVRRALASLPRQGSRAPWRAYQNYLLDLVALRLAPLDDGALEFARRGQRAPLREGRGLGW